MTLTAYHKYLIRVCESDREFIADMIQYDCMQGNDQAFDLVALTGDKTYNRESFLKAADMILKQAGIEKFEPIINP